MTKTHVIGAIITLFLCAQVQATSAQKLLPDSSYQENRFGYSVTVDGPFLASGAAYSDIRGNNSGTVYMYAYQAGQWVETDTLFAPFPIEEAYFGRSVSICNDLLVVGSCGIGDESAYLYSYNGLYWSLVTALSKPAGGRDACFAAADFFFFSMVIVIGPPVFVCVLCGLCDRVFFFA